MTKSKAIKAVSAKSDAATTTKTPPGAGIAGAVVRMDGDTRKGLEAAVGTRNVSFNTNLFVRASRTAFVFQGDDIHAGAEDALNQTATIVGIKAFKPTDPVEAMIAAQAVMLHNLAMEAGRRAQLPQQNAEVASKLRKDAANLSRTMVDMAEALERRRGRGPQVIRVEKMMVANGGQAVVGNITSGTSLPTSAPAIGQGTVAIPIVEEEPIVAVTRGEGEQ